MIIRARELTTDHIGHAVRISDGLPNRHPFVLTGFDSLLWEPNPYTDPGYVLLHERQGRVQQTHPDAPIEVEP